jgi:hypothetical protein
MKNYCICLLLIFNLSVTAQIFVGDYISYKTSFKDEENKENNFVEETKFNIAVFINENKDDGDIIIQDPRIPKKLLAYRIVRFKEEIKHNNLTLEIYEATAEHLDTKPIVTITFYTDEQKNLMISDEKSSQVFFDLISQE